MTQRALAAVAGVPREDVMRIEAGSMGRVTFDRTRRLFEVLGGRVRPSVWWNGAAADRLLDERHAALVERAVAVFRSRGWRTEVEVSFAEYGERGSIDILGAQVELHAVAVAEVKSDLGSLEETNRILDVKDRLAPKIAYDRFGWRPSVIGRILIMPDEDRLRRLVDRHAATMGSAYPARGREVRAWLRRPDRRLRGIWFLSEVGLRDRISA
jgi:hypothetical protein